MNSTLYSNLLCGEVNVVLAGDTISATNSAAKLAKAYLADSSRVYSVNTIYNLRVLNAILRKQLGPEYPIDEHKKTYYFGSSQHGQLGRNHDLQTEVGWDRYDVVIVTTWELAARSYRYREALLFDLAELSNRGVTVIIYSTTSTEPQAGRSDRAGIGKLGLLATNIVSIVKKYHSNIGLTLAEIREAARQSWPEAYEEFVREQEQKKRQKEAVQAVGRTGGRSDVRDLNPANDQRLTTNDSQSAQLSDREINELGTLQPAFWGEEWEVDAQRPTLHPTERPSVRPSDRRAQPESHETLHPTTTVS